jgi:lysophospholipase L1-like esterase
VILGRIILTLIVTALAAGCSGRTPTAPDPPPPPVATVPPSPPAPPVEPPAPPAPPAPPPVTSRTRFLSFGDSITAGTTSPAVQRTMNAGPVVSYPYKLQSMLSARYTTQTITVYNEGLPLEEASDAVRRLPRVLRDTAPEVLILLHGVNDLTGPGVVSRTIGFMNTMVRDARLSGTTVFLCTLLPQRPGGSRAGDPVAIANYNAALRTLAPSEGATLVDLAREVDLSLIGVDGLHPTEAGNERMAQIFFAAIRAQFERPPTTALIVTPGSRK